MLTKTIPTYLRFIPLNMLSALVGKLAEISRPSWLAQLVIRVFAHIYGVDVSTLPKPLSEFKSLSEFFVRDLKSDVRPIPENRDEVVISPVDGVLREVGTCRDKKLIEVKGRAHVLAEFIMDKEYAQRFDGGLYYNFYLRPGDYHHVHSPVTGKIVRSVYIPGSLWPVGDWTLNHIPKLFCRNERIVTYLEWKGGLLAVVMVGAFNVGKMRVVYEKEWEGNKKPWRGMGEIEQKDYGEPSDIRAGDRLGSFYLGSSVVVLLEGGYFGGKNPEYPQEVSYGQIINHM